LPFQEPLAPVVLLHNQDNPLFVLPEECQIRSELLRMTRDAPDWRHVQRCC
jgi:hypothetical protein